MSEQDERLAACERSYDVLAEREIELETENAALKARVAELVTALEDLLDFVDGYQGLKFTGHKAILAKAKEQNKGAGE